MKIDNKSGNKIIQVRNMNAHDIPEAVGAVGDLSLLQRYGVIKERLYETLEQGISRGDRQLIGAWIDEEIKLKNSTEKGETFGNSGLTKRKFAGFALFSLCGTFLMSGYLKLLAVSPEMQGLGVGKALISKMESFVKKESKDLFLFVSDFNTTAKSFYEKVGYQKVGAVCGLILDNVTEELYWKRL